MGSQNNRFDIDEERISELEDKIKEISHGLWPCDPEQAQSHLILEA